MSCVSSMVSVGHHTDMYMCPEKADGFESNRCIQETHYDLVKYRIKQHAQKGSQIHISLNNYILCMYTFPGSFLLYFQCKGTHDCP